MVFIYVNLEDSTSQGKGIQNRGIGFKVVGRWQKGRGDLDFQTSLKSSPSFFSKKEVLISEGKISHYRFTVCGYSLTCIEVPNLVASIIR